MNPRTTPFSFALALLLAVPAAGALAQEPAPAKGPDKEVAEKIAALRECVLDKKLARDEEGRALIDALWQKLEAGVDDKDKQAITKAFQDALLQGKVRPHDNKVLYMAAAAALGYCGPDGAKALKSAYANKRFPEKKDWVPLREQFLKSLGKTKDESMVKFLCNEAQNSPEPALQAAAGEALGNFEEAKEAVRKEIVSELLIQWGDLAEKASQTGAGNTVAQNASDTLAAVTDKWNTTLAKVTKQNFRKFADWQNWYNKHKNQPWQ